MRSLTIVFITLLFISEKINSQNYDYRIITFQDEYTEIDSFHSILLETQGDRGWIKKFDFNFNFPYYDSLYNYIYCGSTSACLFENSLNYEIVLMASGYDFDIFGIDTNNIVSDVRYKLTEKDGIKALVLQYTKVRLISDPSVEEYDSHLNFQLWYFENGSMEVRFGSYNLVNSPNYIPGEGFYLFPNNNEPINYGPEMVIRNSFKEDVGLGLDGNYDDYVVDNIGGYLKSLPPVGWVIRFERFIKSSTTEEIVNFENIFPNPTTGNLYIAPTFEIDHIEIIDITGARQSFVYQGNKVNIEHLNPGVYFVKLISNEKYIVKKIVKL